MRLRIAAIAMFTLIAGLLGAQNMFGAFQIITEPSGATITLTGTNQYLGSTPSQIFPVMMDQYMVYNCGIPGRVFNIYITKNGYIPIQQEIFVPYNKAWQQDAIRYPTIFSFALTREYVQPPVYCPPPLPPRPARPPRPVFWYNWLYPRPHYPQPYCPPPTPPNPPNPPHPPGGGGPGSGYGGHGSGGGPGGGHGGTGHGGGGH